MNWALLLFVIGIVFIAAWAYHALRAHNAVRNAEQEILRMTFKGQDKPDLMNDFRVPETFDEIRMAADLRKIAWSPTLVGQYLAKAEIRFTKKQERHILESWTQLYNAGKEVIQSRTEMARAYKEYQDLNIETQTSAKSTRVYMANLDADQAEAQLRKAQAQKARKDLNKKEESPPAPPPLTPEQERILKKNEIQTTIGRLQRERDEKLRTITDEDDRMRTQNMYDDEIARWQEKLRRYL